MQMSCIETDCNKLASFGPSGTNIRLYCKTHKTNDMINTINPICLKCTTQATYGTEECRKITCSKHKLMSMIHISAKIKDKDEKTL